jgi:outer membrane protein OmpA-like peptidoglycan-associated protein
MNRPFSADSALFRHVRRDFHSGAVAPRRALETVGYGEEFLLVPTQNENWRNRRVTLRRFDDFLTQ